MPREKPKRFDSSETPDGFAGVVAVARGAQGHEVRQMAKGKGPKKVKADHPNKDKAMDDATNLAGTTQWVRIEGKSST
jgi:hypothetical protein